MNRTVILTKLNRIVPKKDIILFNSYPPASDNALALYRYLVANRPDITRKYKIIWCQESKNAPDVIADENYLQKNHFEGSGLFCGQNMLFQPMGMPVMYDRVTGKGKSTYGMAAASKV